MALPFAIIDFSYAAVSWKHQKSLKIVIFADESFSIKSTLSEDFER